MAITVDTVQLRFKIKPDYDQQQIQQLQSDLKQSQKNIEAERKEMDKYAKTLNDTRVKLREAIEERDKLAKQKTRTTEEMQRLGELNQAINKYEDEIMDAKNAIHEHGVVLDKNIAVMNAAEDRLKDYTTSMNINKMSIAQLGERQKELNRLVNALNPQTDDYKRYKEELDGIGKRIKELRKEGLQLHEGEKLQSLTLNELSERQRALNAAIADCNPNDDDFKDYAKALQETKDRMSELQTEADGTKTSLSKFVDGFNKFAWAIQFAYQGFQKVVQWADQYVQAFAKMDDAMTDVMKYTGQTKAEVEDMNEAFKQMTTRTAREELNALAGAAGRLGIQGKENIVGFVDAADKINVALGDDLGEGAIDQIGKLTMVFGEDKTKGLNGAMLATGSAINVLGANSSANTGFITEFTSSMAGMAVNAKISQTDIMGYASALSQAGIEGQTASGVFAQLITKMFTDPAKFAKAARLDVKSFTDLLKTDANAAILQFLEGLRANGGFDALAPALKSLKMQGTQAVPVISSLINKMDELKKAQADAKQAYDEGTSIIEEFNNANSSAAAKLEMKRKAMNDAAATLGQQLMPIVEKSLNATTSFIKIITPVAKVLMDNSTAFLQLAAAVAAYNIAVNIAAIKTALYNAAAATATKVTKAWNAAIAAGPYGIFAAAVSLMTTEIIRYVMRAREATEIQEGLNDAMTEAKKDIVAERTEMKQLIGTVKSATSSENERKEALEKLNGKLMSLHLGNLTEEMVRTGDLTTVLDAYNRKLETQIKLKRLQAKQEELINKKIDLEEGGYKDDISFGDRIAQGLAAMGQSMISGHLQGFRTAWNAEWDRVEDSYKKRALRPVLEGLETVETKMKEIREQEEAEANRIDYVGEIVVSGGKTKEVSSSADTETDKERNARQKKLQQERKEKEDLVKAEYEREKILLREQYQNKKQEQDKWHEEEFQSEQKYISRLAEIRKDYGASESDRMEVQNMMLDSLSKEANRKEEVKKRQHQETMEAIDREQAAAEIGLIRQRLDGEIATEEEYSRRKLAVEIEYQRKRVMELKTGSAEYQAAQKQLLSLELQQLQQNKKDDNSFKSDFQSTNNRMLHNNFEGESFERMRELNEEYREKDLISYQQYQENLSEIAQAESDKRQAIQQAAVDGVSNLLSSASQLFSAMQQRETAAVDAKYKKLIASAKKQGKDTTKLEEQQEAEKQAIAKKYADRNFQIQVLQIVGNTAQGISKTIAELGMPWAVPFVAMAAAAGAMQLASAKAAADQASGLYSGGFSDEYQEGYTRKGDPRKQAGVIPVHQNEFVANHKAVANPNVRPVLDVIDRHQKVGDIQMLDSTRMLEEAYGRGRYRGGYVQPDAGGELSQGDGFIGSASDNSEAMQLLRTIARNTGTSLTVRGLRREIRHEEQLEKNASR